MSALAFVGAGAVSLLSGLGDVALLITRVAMSLPRMDRRELLRELVHFGYGSLGLSVGVAAVTGIIVVLQTSLYVERFGARAFMGWAAGFIVLWELGPLLLGLLLAARVGARNAAELATLQVGGQLEGLRGVSLDPFALLIAPRVIALALSGLALSGVAFTVAIGTEAVAAALTLRIPWAVFWANFSDMVRPVDLIAGVTKVFVFTCAIAIVSTAVALKAQGGARAVGRAAAAAVVQSAGALFALDFLLTPLLTAVLQ